MLNTIDIDVTNIDYRDERTGHGKKAIHHVEQKARREGRSGIGIMLGQVMLQMFVANMDAAEFYSPPRATPIAREMGLRAGWGPDLTTNGEDGRA